MPWSSAQRARWRQVASAVLAGRLSLVVVSRKASVSFPQESLWVTVMGPKGFFFHEQGEDADASLSCLTKTRLKYPGGVENISLPVVPFILLAPHWGSPRV